LPIGTSLGGFRGVKARSEERRRKRKVVAISVPLKGVRNAPPAGDIHKIESCITNPYRRAEARCVRCGVDGCMGGYWFHVEA
jgi:hypothetical protein